MLRLHGLLLVLICCNAVNAQNVFDPNDVLVQYDSTAAPGSAANPAKPPEFVMSKWVRTPRVAWNTSNFKSYTWRGMSFRLRFPNNYNPANATKYPVVVFFHGGGEIGGIYDNEFQLLQGPQLFEQRINNGDWNGFLLFPQQTAIGWDDYYFSRINGVLDTLQKYNRADPDRVISIGLSLGGYGAVAYGSFYPGRVAAMLPASPAQIRTLNGSINNYKHIPIWMANGGFDNNPDPPNASAFCKEFRAFGGDIYQSYYANTGHDTWNLMWNQVNAGNKIILTDYFNNAHKAQPLLFFQQQQFCSGSPITARMGISAGYAVYEWDKNGAVIPGATGNEYTATSAGQYRVRFRRQVGGEWSAWTPHPVIISTKTCVTDTLFAEHFSNDNFFVAASSYSFGNFGCEGGVITSGTDQITQDATGIQGSRFLVNYTYAAGGGCSYNVNDRVWSNLTPVPVKPNTNYEYSFSLGNLNSASPAKLVPAINGAPITDSFASVTASGNGTWKKFSFTWNSGNATSADLSILNRVNETTGNDFAIDEISFKAVTALPLPSCVVNTQPLNGATLASQNTAALSWASAATAISYDVYIWTGDSIPSIPKANVTGTAYTANGLVAGTTYKWYIAPRNAFGAGSNCSSNATSFTTALTPAPACVINSAPANGETVIGRTSATLTWPASATATSYDVYIWTGTAMPATPAVNVTLTSYTAAGLSPSTTYKWYIAPRNAFGAATTCAAGSTTSFNTAGSNFPGEACILNSSPVDGSTISTDNTATLIWRAVPNADNYDVFVWTGNRVPSTPITNTSLTNFDLTGLLPATTYKWYVRPKNEKNKPTGCKGITSSFITAALPPIVTDLTGLKGDYYNNPNLAGSFALTRTDAAINFDWGSNGPATPIDPKTFSVRWTGRVMPAHTERYTFYTQCSEGARLWVNGQLLVDNWKDGAAEASGSINLTAGVKYDLLMEYFEKKGNGVAKLLWASASTVKTIIPSQQLFLPAVTIIKNRPAGKLLQWPLSPIRAADATLHDISVVNTMQVYPNPLPNGHDITLQFNAGKSGYTSIQIMNGNGTILQQEKINTVRGMNTRTLHVAGLRPGIYMIQVLNESGNPAVQKLIIN